MNTKIVGLVCGILVTPIALLLAVLSGGTGHGDYLAARLLYPIPMMCTYLMQMTPSSLFVSFASLITPLALILACAQYPLYGWLVGAMLKNEKRKLGLKMLGCHLFALATVLIFPSSLIP